MSITNNITTNFVDETGADLGDQLIEKSHLIDIYPNLNPCLITPTLWALGSDALGTGIIGDNTTVAKSSPVQTIAFGANWKQVADNFKYNTGVSGTTANCQHLAAIKNDGTLWVWGANAYGQLGDNTTVKKSSPIQTVTGGTNWQQVASGKPTAAVKTDGTLWMWGGNNFGQLGDNTTIHKSSPVQTVSAGTNWKQVSCAYSNCAAIKTDGTLWTWGSNGNGQLGDNTGDPVFGSANKSSPVQTITRGTNWKYVVAGNLMAAIKTDGTLWTWGNNTFGGLGDNTVFHRSSPVQTVAGGNNWKQVSTNSTYRCAAIKTDGTLWNWGGNSSAASTQQGALGDNTTVHKSSPVQTISGGTNWQQVSCGSLYTTALKTDGTVWAWGYNGVGTLGDNTTVDRSSPVQIASRDTNWKYVAAGYITTFLIKDYNF